MKIWIVQDEEIARALTRRASKEYRTFIHDALGNQVALWAWDDRIKDVCGTRTLHEVVSLVGDTEPAVRARTWVEEVSAPLLKAREERRAVRARAEDMVIRFMGALGVEPRHPSSMVESFDECSVELSLDLGDMPVVTPRDLVNAEVEIGCGITIYAHENGVLITIDYNRPVGETQC